MKSSPSACKKNKIDVWLVSVGATLAILLVAGFFLWQTKTYTSLILLQNTDEKRATGGFLGSVAVVRHHGSSIDHWQIYDIYESDGQIQEFLPAPSAVQQYLVAGKNELHLPDANWERDFPTASREIVTLFTRAGRPQPDFVISVNLTTIEKLLDKIGGLSWSEATAGASLITSDNLATQARAQRRDFFPGDTQKTDFLRPAATQLRQQLHQLSFWKKIATWRFFWQEARQHQLYFFAFDNFWQKIFQLLGISGETRNDKNCSQIYWVESNVGINKSNRLVQRETEIAETQNQLTLTAHWHNNNKPILSLDSSWQDRLHYANYQRLLLPSGVSATAITVDGATPQSIDWREVTDADGETWQEVGFLLIVNEQASSTAQISLTQNDKTCWQVDFN